MRRRLLIILSLAVLIALGRCALADVGTDLYRCDFANPKAYEVKGGWRLAANGTVLHKDLAGFGSLKLLGVPDLAGRNFSILFEAREIEVAGNDRLKGHWGFRVVNANGDSTLFYSHATGFHCQTKSASGQEISTIHDASGEKIAFERLDGTDAGKWSAVRLAVTDAGFRLYVNGRLTTSSLVKVAPARNLSFHCFHRVVELRNLRIVADAARGSDFAREPTFVYEGAITTQREFREARPVSGEGGAISFWTHYDPGMGFVTFENEAGEALARFYHHGDLRLHADIRMEGAANPLAFSRRLYREQDRPYREDVHYAFTWGPDGKARFFLNGLPYPTQYLAREDLDLSIAGNRLGETTRLVFPKNAPHRKRPYTVSDVKVYRRPLTNAEVLADYRRRMPIDLVVQEGVYEVGREVCVTLSAAPGGRYMKPHPAPDVPFNKAVVDLDFKIERLLGPNKAESVAGGETTVRGLKVDAPVPVSCSPVALTEPGKYRVVATVRPVGVSPERPYVRTLFFEVIAPLPSRADASKDRWQKDERIFAHTFAAAQDAPLHDGPVSEVTSASCGSYLEAGPKGSLSGDRYGRFVTFPADAIGKPCLLEVKWPDDKPRGIGLCLFPETTRKQSRDRLMQGIICGDKYRNQNRLRTTEYLFFPSSTNYLFEVRTLFKDRPGAVASLAAYRLCEPLPQLKVHRPEGLPCRRYGHEDEDQTFDWLLNNVDHGGFAGTTEELLRYFGYTGENLFQYSIFRYTSTADSVEGNVGMGLFPGGTGQILPFARRLQDNGVAFVGQYCLWNDPGVALFDKIDSDWRARGFLSLDRDGNDRAGLAQGAFTANIANPELQDMYFAYGEDLLRRGAETGAIKAVQIPTGLFGRWRSPEFGYDDWTVAAFARTLSLDERAPILTRKAESGADYRARYELLWKGGLKAKWVRWRADRVTEFFARQVAFVKSCCPEADVILTVQLVPDGYEEHGYDLAALTNIPEARLSIGRNYNRCWFKLYREGKTPDEFNSLYDFSDPETARLLAKDGALALFRSGQSYFETFRDSLDPKNHASYFQSLDAKPVGRDFLRESAFAVGAYDALSASIGAQQLATWGVEDEVREFTQAYCALPALPFKDLPGSDLKTVVMRSCETKNDTYLYAVNMTDAPHEVSFSRTASALDLSSDKTVSLDRISLKPYELRSFRSCEEGR